jgi:hypothetical protein
VATRCARPRRHRLPIAARNIQVEQIENRLFSDISMNWRGRPLKSHEVIVETSAATTTRTGLTVHAELDTRNYPKGIKITDQQMEGLERRALRHHDFHGERNCTLVPNAPATRRKPACY